MIDDVISLFIEYYSKKIPSLHDIIRRTLLCYGMLLRLTDGKCYQELRWKIVQDSLEEIVDKEFADIFLKEICMEFKGEKFFSDIQEFDAKIFLKGYHEFIKKACNYHFGIIRIGAFTVWRSMLKYFEELHRHSEFYTKKGALLENWCYSRAIEKKLDVIKIILINSNESPTDTYVQMEEQTRNWKGDVLELEAVFPEDYDYYFQEIDLTIKMKDILILLECKGTSSPIGEIGDFFLWAENLNRNYVLLQKKCKLLKSNIQNNTLDNEYFNNIKRYVILQIQTEGIVLRGKAIPTYEYDQFIQDIKDSIENNSVHSFLTKYRLDLIQ